MIKRGEKPNVEMGAEVEEVEVIDADHIRSIIEQLSICTVGQNAAKDLAYEEYDETDKTDEDHDRLSERIQELGGEYWTLAKNLREELDKAFAAFKEREKSDSTQAPQGDYRVWVTYPHKTKGSTEKKIGIGSVKVSENQPATIGELEARSRGAISMEGLHNSYAEFNDEGLAEVQYRMVDGDESELFDSTTWITRGGQIR